MFSISPGLTENMKYTVDSNNALVALSHWFIINNLKAKAPVIDPVLARIYFETFRITVSPDVKDLQEAANEYEPDIIRFFLLCQRQRCLKALKDARNIIKSINIVLPIQCKPFFEEMMTLSEKVGQHNIMTKETQVLDSLRDTIIANNLQPEYKRPMSLTPDKPRVSTSGKYILTDAEKMIYLDMLTTVVEQLYRPIFMGDKKARNMTRPVYALTDMYEDSGTRFMKIVDYIKSALFMICTSIDQRIVQNVWSSTPTIIPSLQEDMFSVIEQLIAYRSRAASCYDNIRKECSQYGGLTLNHAICLPHNTPVGLEGMKIERNAISLTFKFLVCQELIEATFPTLPEVGGVVQYA